MWGTGLQSHGCAEQALLIAGDEACPGQQIHLRSRSRACYWTSLGLTVKPRASAVGHMGVLGRSEMLGLYMASHQPSFSWCVPLGTPALHRLAHIPRGGLLPHLGLAVQPPAPSEGKEGGSGAQPGPSEGLWDGMGGRPEGPGFKL